MEELIKYNESIIGLYEKGFSIDHIVELLYEKVNKKLKTFNRVSHGELWVCVPKVSKAECIKHVYKIIYNKKMKNNGGN